jgi:hypothetical protein
MFLSIHTSFISLELSKPSSRAPLTDSTEWGAPREANICSDIQEVAEFYETRSFITAVTRVHHWSLS